MTNKSTTMIFLKKTFPVGNIIYILTCQSWFHFGPYSSMLILLLYYILLKLFYTFYYIIVSVYQSFTVKKLRIAE